MAVLWFDGLLLQADEAGVYFLPEDDAGELREAAAVNGFRCLRVGLGECVDGVSLVAALAGALHLPAYAAGGLASFADALCELRGHDARGLVLLLEGSEGLRHEAMADFKAMMESLQSASRCWAARGTPLWSFVAMGEDEFDALDDAGG